MMIYNLFKKHLEYNTWLLNNIYIDLGKNIVNNINLDFEEQMLYRESIPDFITGNENNFIIVSPV